MRIPLTIIVYETTEVSTMKRQCDPPENADWNRKIRLRGEERHNATETSGPMRKPLIIRKAQEVRTDEKS